jgi:hypothetical protein
MSSMATLGCEFPPPLAFARLGPLEHTSLYMNTSMGPPIWMSPTCAPTGSASTPTTSLPRAAAITIAGRDAWARSSSSSQRLSTICAVTILSAKPSACFPIKKKSHKNLIILSYQTPRQQLFRQFVATNKYRLYPEIRMQRACAPNIPTQISVKK